MSAEEGSWMEGLDPSMLSEPEEDLLTLGNQSS